MRLFIAVILTCGFAFTYGTLIDPFWLRLLIDACVASLMGILAARADTKNI